MLKKVKRKDDGPGSRRFYALAALLFLFTVFVGTFLRLHMLSAQILLDDEWHMVKMAADRTVLEVATDLNPTDNSGVPLNLYYWALYHGFHLSEWTVRLPSIIAGVLSLVLMPWMIEKVIGRGVAFVFASLLAIAPVLVFYSRFARAYSLTALLCVAVLMLSHEWLTTSRLRYATGFVLVGSFAIYVHLTSIIAVFAPLLLAFGSLLADRLELSSSTSKRIVASTRARLIVLGAITLLSLPPVLSVVMGSETLRWGMGTPTVRGVLTALSMISGTTSPPLGVLFFILCAVGHVLLWKERPLLGRILACTTVLYVVVLLASRPFGIGAGLVLVRYMIVAVPIALIGVAQAIERVTARLMVRRPDSYPIACAGGGILLAGCLFFTGPLPELQRSPNNFTGHSAFQGSYDPPRWDRSDARHVYPAVSRRADQLPPFYLWLRDRADVAAIVEYPFDVCNNNNLFYFYQHFHGKRVFAGYCSDSSRVGVTLVQGDTAQEESAKTRLSADAILSRVPADRRIAFRNMVDLANRGSLLASSAGIVVLHKVIQTVGFNPDGTVNAVAMHFTSVDRFSAEFRESFGPPVYEDGELVCYRIKHAGEH